MKTSLINTKLRNLVNLVKLFLTMWIIVANPIIYRLVPRPSRFETRQFRRRIQGRWNGWIFTPLFSEPPSFFFIFLSLKYWNNIWFLWHYYKNSPPFENPGSALAIYTVCRPWGNWQPPHGLGSISAAFSCLVYLPREERLDAWAANHVCDVNS